MRYEARRLTGPSLLLDGPGVVLEASLPQGREEAVIAAWRERLAALLEAVGWKAAAPAVRQFEGGASLAFPAPMDTLYAATRINEWAFEAASGGGEPLAEAAAAIAAEIEAERNPRLVALAAEAARRGVTFLPGDDLVSLGLGRGARTWPERQLPDPAEIDWDRVQDVPVALVTGTNGKSTTVRLLAAMAQAADQVAGLSSSDWVRVGDDILDRGDYSGPSGARLALRDPRVEVAVLELARGGILRRGLPVSRATVAVVTNVAADHLGEYGILDVEALADAKLVVAKAVRQGGRLVLNADDPRLAARAGAAGAAEVAWFSLAPGHGIRDGAVLEDGALALRRGGRSVPVLPAAEVTIGYGGSARHNLANALAALAAADALKLPVAAMATALRRFGAAAEDNPGRGVRREIRGVQFLVDFAHNAHGVTALADLVAAIPAKRRLVLLGQAGDRTDAELREMTQAIWAMRPDRIVVKEMASLLRGRTAGELPALLKAELARLGVPSEAVADAASEMDAVRQALAWAEPGDLLVLLSHVARGAILALLDRLVATGWRPGQPLPPS
jgi:UDP-N-acetylmuramyl tripeptide synthase